MMEKDRPPTFALWLLRKFGSRAYRESLAGDLIEACGRGRGRAWVWREVLHAISAAVMPRSFVPGWLSAIKGVILAVGLIMLGAATFSWAASLTDDSPSSVSRGP